MRERHRLCEETEREEGERKKKVGKKREEEIKCER
jgi:hypothetical protein